MKQEFINDSLSKSIENDFAEDDNFQPIELKSSEVPEDEKEDLQTIRKNLYNLNDKVNSAIDWLLTNMDTMVNQPGIIKQSPTDSLVECIKAGVSINDKLMKFHGIGSAPKNVINKQNNLNVIPDKSEPKLVDVKELDNLIKNVKTEFKS